jgi:hypothetical protein
MQHAPLMAAYAELRALLSSYMVFFQRRKISLYRQTRYSIPTLANFK